MQPAKFEQAVEKILQKDQRFDPQAYLFLKDSLDFTLKRAAENNKGKARHVSGPELLEGFRDLALQEFGPMAATLMDEWGLKESGNVGEIVFLLINEEVFGKQESDTLEDFQNVFDFHQAFVAPYLPQQQCQAS